MGERAKLFAPQYGGPPIVIPADKGDVIELPEPHLPKSPGHHREWLAACKQHQTTSCDFSYGARLTEICLLGNIAIRCGRTIQWDEEQMRATNGVDVEHFLRREYRTGWSREL